MEGAFLLSFSLAELIGQDEAGELSAGQSDLLRLLTSIAKLTTARQAAAVASEVLEAFGGAGYVEDTGLPALLRDSQVLPIWEGTTNVLALDALRAIGEAAAGWSALDEHIRQCIASAREARLVEAGQVAAIALSRAQSWLHEALNAGGAMLELGARRFTLTIGRTLELALLIEQAQWSLDHEGDMRPRAAALRFAHSQIDLIANVDLDTAALLANDE